METRLTNSQCTETEHRNAKHVEERHDEEHFQHHSARQHQEARRGRVEFFSRHQFTNNWQHHMIHNQPSDNQHLLMANIYIQI